MKGYKYLFLLALICTIFRLDGQTLSSTYSNNGIGILNFQGTPSNLAMGEVGMAVPSNWELNFQNPAFLPLNRFSLFQVGIQMDRRQVESSDFSGREVAGGLKSLNYAFPVVNGKWTTAIGLTPYSSSNLRKFSQVTLDDESVEITQLVNSGGLSVFNWSNGFRVKNNLFVGLRAALIFGSITYSERKAIEDISSFSSSFTDESSYSGLKLDAFMGYRHDLDDDRKLNFGLSYGLGETLTGSRDLIFQSELTEVASTFDEETSYKLPSSVGFGVSYQVINQWLVTSDLAYTNWSSAGTPGADLVNTLKVGIGGQWTPDYSSVNSYLNRVTYRLGINFDNLPYKVNDQVIRELGINFGTSLPIGYSSLDVAFKYGTLGTLNNSLNRETYFRIAIGATINDRWFVKRRYD